MSRISFPPHCKLDLGETTTSENKVSTIYENEKRIVIIDEKSFKIYRFDKDIWSRPEAFRYINTIVCKEKKIKHTDLFWAWKLEI